MAGAAKRCAVLPLAAVAGSSLSARARRPPLLRCLVSPCSRGRCGITRPAAAVIEVIVRRRGCTRPARGIALAESIPIPTFVNPHGAQPSSPELAATLIPLTIFQPSLETRPTLRYTSIPSLTGWHIFKPRLDSTRSRGVKSSLFSGRCGETSALLWPKESMRSSENLAHLYSYAAPACHPAPATPHRPRVVGTSRGGFQGEAAGVFGDL